MPEAARTRQRLAHALVAATSQVLCRRVSSGVVAAIELLVATPPIVEALENGEWRRIDELIRTGEGRQMRLLDDVLFSLYRAGVIDAQQAIDKARHPGAMTERIEHSSDDEGGEALGNPVPAPRPGGPDRPKDHAEDNAA